MRFETLAVHAGHSADPSGGVAPAIQLSTTFVRDAEGVPVSGHTYIRESNPNQTQLEAAAALVFASGMAAGMALLQCLPPGSHVVFPDDVYYGFRDAAHDFLPQWGIASDFVGMEDLDALARVLRPETRVVWLETPSNPMLKVVDLAAAAALARAAGARTVVDNTFATPVLQRPLELGLDVVLHSSTKYFGGHSDVLGGVASPFNCWLVLRGLRTLACRMAVQSAGALAVAEAMAEMPEVAAVHYPGLPGHPGHAIAARQMSAFGAMLSLRVRAGREAALRAVSRVRLFTRATSLGAVESLIEHRATSEGPTSRNPQDLLRLSIGLEHPDDLIEDLRQALSS